MEFFNTSRLRAATILTLGLLTLLAACSPPSDNETPGESASQLLAGVIDDFWQHMLDTEPLARLDQGLPVERLEDYSYEEAQRGAAFRRGLLDRLARVDATALDHQETLSLEILEWQLEIDVEGLKYFWHRYTMTPYVSPTRGLRILFTTLPVHSAADRERYLALVGQVPGVIEQFRTIQLGQLERGIVPPRAALPNITSVFEAWNRPAETSPFFVSDQRLADATWSGDAPDENPESFQARLAEIIAQEINPAWERFHDLVKGEVHDRAVDTVGVLHLPDGEEYYRYLVRRYTTFDAEPEEVHRIGLEMVAELEAGMDEVQREVGFEGSHLEFREHLRNDPRFFPTSPDEVAERLLDASNAFFARIDEFFVEKPEAPYGVRRLSATLESSMTYGFYDAPTESEPTGYYNYNGSKLDERSWLNLRGVSFHELVPGHHFQISRQLENQEIPAFRRHLYPIAYIEGWGSYATVLGLEADLVEDPYSRYGVYALEAFLANRLVVDPGLNVLGWPLEKARQYMREHSLESPTQIATETLRYSADRPAQAVAYQMGKRKFLDLRRKAHEALGERFDVRTFHEALLENGAMPFTVLEKHVDAYIERER